MVTGHVARGPEPTRLAEALRASLNVPYALPVGQGRVAIARALHALGLGSDDEVVLPSYVCASVLDAVRYAGLKPIFADVGPDLHVTSETVAAALTPKTKCVIVPHLFGNTAPIEEIDRKSTRLNSSHGYISYAVFCLKKKKHYETHACPTRVCRLLLRKTQDVCLRDGSPRTTLT